MFLNDVHNISPQKKKTKKVYKTMLSYETDSPRGYSAGRMKNRIRAPKERR